MRTILGIIGAGALAVACGGIAQTGSGGKPIDGLDAGPGGGAGGDGAGGGGGAQGGGTSAGGAPSGGTAGCVGPCPSGGTGGTLPWGDGGAAGAPWDGGGSGGGASCAQTSDPVTIDFSPLPSADGGFNATTDVIAQGRVTSVTSNAFTIDTCPPNADCTLYTVKTVTIDAPGLDLSLPLVAGAFARVHYNRTCPWGCQSAITVASLSSWGGISNPHPAASGLYVAADDGSSTGDEPYKMEQVPIPGCTTQGTGCGAGMITGAYLQRFSANGGSIDVLMGQTQGLGLGGGIVQFRNLRSQVNGYCDEMGDFAHYAVDQYLLPL